MFTLFLFFFFFFFNDPAPPEIYPFPLHDALPILASRRARRARSRRVQPVRGAGRRSPRARKPLEAWFRKRSEEHTSELQSPCNLVCRLLLEKKKKDHLSKDITHVNLDVVF